MLDLSCRLCDGKYWVVTDRWQQFSQLALSEVRAGRQRCWVQCLWLMGALPDESTGRLMHFLAWSLSHNMLTPECSRPPGGYLPFCAALASRDKIEGFRSG